MSITAVKPPTVALTVTITQAAIISGVARVTVERWVAEGTIPSKKVGGTRLIPKAAFLEILGVGEVAA